MIRKAAIRIVVTVLAISTVAAHARAAELQSFSSYSSTLAPYGYWSKDHIWANHKVDVCWDNPKDVSPDKLLLVHDAVVNAWEYAGNVVFVGWQACATTNQPGIHIFWLDDGSPPETRGVGTRLDGAPHGVTLNPTYKLWGNEHCGPKVNECIKSDAIHAFGHVLGLLHESLRDDAPKSCKDLPQVEADHSNVLDATDGTTPYDPDSVMNYCNKMLGISLSLSHGDQQVISIIYGLPLK